MTDGSWSDDVRAPAQRWGENLDALMTVVMDAAATERQIGMGNLGGWMGVRELAPHLRDHPLLPVACRLAADALAQPAEAGAEGDIKVAVDELCTAVLETRSPAAFGEATECFLESPALLAMVGNQLARAVIEQATPPASDATRQQVLRAATALEVATRLRIGAWDVRWDLYALLSRISGPLPLAYARSVLRAVVACVETWDDAGELIGSARRVLGLDPSVGGHQNRYGDQERVTSAPEAVLTDLQSDGAVALARMSTFSALRAADHDSLVAHLDDAARALKPALTEDERVDARITHRITQLLRHLVSGEDGAAVADSGDAHHSMMVDVEIVADLVDDVREYRWASPGSHWVGERFAASQVAWANLATGLQRAQQRFSEPSWYRPAAVIGDIVEVYRIAGSSTLVRREEDGAAVRGIVLPALGSGFAAQASLLRHLNDHVTALADANGADLSRQQRDDLQVAEELLAAATEELTARGAIYRPKEGAGDREPTTSRPSASTTDLLELASYTEAVTRIEREVARREQLDLVTTGSLVADELVQRARAGLADASDYEGDARLAMDLTTNLLVRFLWDRNQIGKAEAEYLFKHDVKEDELATDLRNFLRSTGRLHDISTEVRHRAGGRVDVEMGFPGFNLYVELKVDTSTKPLGDKVAYLKQSASYQVVDKRLGFLLVLRVLSTRTVAPHLSSALEVIQVDDGTPEPRYVVAMTLPGGRTAPSHM